MAFTFGLPWGKRILGGGGRGRKPNRQCRPADGAYRKTSFRPQLELLEDRLTPSFSLNLIPVAHVAVNPQPLPPFPVVECDPLPNLPSRYPRRGSVDDVRTSPHLFVADVTPL